MLLLPNASCCKSITCGKLQNKHLEALGNSTDFMLLGLGDRHLPQPACCGNYNLLPLPYLFLYLYRLYQYCTLQHDFCVSFKKFPSRFFLIFQDSRSLDSHPPKTGSVFRAMVACIVQDWKEVSERPKNLEETTKLKTNRGWKPPPEDAPKFFSYKPFRLQISPFLTQIHIFLDRKMLIFQTN